MGDALIGRFDALLCDLDGVVYRGDHAIAGAPDALRRARGSGTPVVYVTNNASRPPATVAEQISRLGAPAEAGDVVGSAQVAAKLLAARLEPGAPVTSTGAQALAREVSAAGLCPVASQAEGPRAVVQGFDPRLGWEQLAEAAYVLADPAVVWCATNTDRTIPKERGIAPGNGTLVAAVAAATGREPLVAGKPEAAIFEEAARRAGARRPAVVGDRLDTDIRGARNAAMPGVQVLTGIDTPETVLRAAARERPAYLIATLDELFEAYPDPEVTAQRDGARAVCRDALAVATRESVTVTGQESGLDGWRAACAAWWVASSGRGTDRAAAALGAGAVSGDPAGAHDVAPGESQDRPGSEGPVDGPGAAPAGSSAGPAGESAADEPGGRPGGRAEVPVQDDPAQADPHPPVTGLAEVDEILAREPGVRDLPLTRRAAAYERLLAELEAVLDCEPGTPPDTPAQP